MSAETLHIRIANDIDIVELLGKQDEFLRMLEQRFDVRMTVRDRELELFGDAQEVHALSMVISELVEMLRHNVDLTEAHVGHAIDLVRSDSFTPRQFERDVILIHKGRAVKPKTPGQRKYVEAIQNHTITFGIGPAGTGKTYLAIAHAVAALKRKEIERIVLTRPVVEAGENLGFLPGTLGEKVDPYMRPLYDALYEMLERERVHRFLEDGTIEIAPLAYMRGRTLNHSFVILDEAQNATPSQMKMFLTRLGSASRMVVTGDVTQRDLPHGVSALIGIRDILGNIDEIAFCTFDSKDVVRHSLVAQVIAAYDEAEDRK